MEAIDETNVINHIVSSKSNTQLSASSPAVNVCERGHTWIDYLNISRHRCEICAIQFQLCKKDPAIKPIETSYIVGVISHEFVCGRGHRFMCTIAQSRSGCRSCALYARVCAQIGVSGRSLLLDKLSIYDENRPMRWECNRLRHDPACKCEPEPNRKYAIGCTNVTICGQDYLATPRQMKSCIDIIRCDLDHQSEMYRGWFTTVRIFETYFDDRMDDRAPILMSGYSMKHKIGFTYFEDYAADRVVSKAAAWCKEMNITFVYVHSDKPGHMKPAKICRQLFMTLIDRGIISADLDICIKQLRTTLRERAAAHQLLKKRCV